jgi:hypothetical protein
MIRARNAQDWPMVTTEQIPSRLIIAIGGNAARHPSRPTLRPG